MKAKYALIYMSVFTFIDVGISFFIPSYNIAVQTVYALMKISVFLLFIDMLKVESIQYKFLKIVVNGFWGAFMVLYIVNAFKHPNYEDWRKHFNDYDTLVPFFVGTTLFIIMYSLKKLKHEEIS